MKENISLQSNEEIKPIQGYEGLYSITSFGRMWSHAKKRGFIRQKGKFLRYNTDKDGYVYYTLSKERNLKSYKSHILVARAFILNLHNLPEVNHKDGDKQNNFAGTAANNYTDGNLEWCTDQENHNHVTINRLYKNKKSSDYYGVTYSRNRKRTKRFWIARVTYNNKTKYIGSYFTEIEAAQAYNDYVIEHSLNRPLNEF